MRNYRCHGFRLVVTRETLGIARPRPAWRVAWTEPGAQIVHIVNATRRRSALRAAVHTIVARP